MTHTLTAAATGIETGAGLNCARFYGHQPTLCS